MDRVFHPLLLRKSPRRETCSVPHQALAEKKRTEGLQWEERDLVARLKEKSKEK